MALLGPLLRASQAAIRVLAESYSYLETRLGKKPFLNTFRFWQNSFPFGCLTPGLAIGWLLAGGHP